MCAWKIFGPNSTMKAAESRNWCSKCDGSKLMPKPGRSPIASSALRVVGKSYAISVGWTSSAKRTPSASKTSMIGPQRSANSWYPASTTAKSFGGKE